MTAHPPDKNRDNARDTTRDKCIDKTIDEIIDKAIDKNGGAPPISPVQPVELKLDSRIQFDCHKGVSCFNACCKSIDITLMPYDILRLKRRAGLTSSQWVARYTVPFAMDAHDMPGLKMAVKPGTSECVFLKKSGCSVYADRPGACRYYALGSMGMRRTAEAKVEDIYFVVKEEHCKGHAEPKHQTVREYRRAQGIEKYDDMNRDWRDIIIKKRSAGPTIGKPSARSLQLFDMCSYDIDNFRAFLNSPGFVELFDIGNDERTAMEADEDALLHFAYRFLKQVLFGEMTIPLKPDARQRRLKRHERHAKKSRGT